MVPTPAGKILKRLLEWHLVKVSLPLQLISVAFTSGSRPEHAPGTWRNKDHRALTPAFLPAPSDASIAGPGLYCENHWLLNPSPANCANGGTKISLLCLPCCISRDPGLNASLASYTLATFCDIQLALNLQQGDLPGPGPSMPSYIYLALLGLEFRAISMGCYHPVLEVPLLSIGNIWNSLWHRWQETVYCTGNFPQGHRSQPSQMSWHKFLSDRLISRSDNPLHFPEKRNHD